MSLGALGRRDSERGRESFRNFRNKLSIVISLCYNVSSAALEEYNEETHSRAASRSAFVCSGSCDRSKRSDIPSLVGEHDQICRWQPRKRCPESKLLPMHCTEYR